MLGGGFVPGSGRRHVDVAFARDDVAHPTIDAPGFADAVLLQIDESADDQRTWDAPPPAFQLRESVKTAQRPAGEGAFTGGAFPGMPL